MHASRAHSPSKRPSELSRRPLAAGVNGHWDFPGGGHELSPAV